MKIVIAGGGMVGLMLARLLRMRGFEPTVFERMKEGAYIPRGYMLGYHGYPPFEELGILHQIREQGWDIAPKEDGTAVAIAVNVGTVLHLLARELPVEYEHSVVGLLRDSTERPETVSLGTNELIGTDPAALKPTLDKLFAGQWKKGSVPELWDGRSGERIAEILDRLLAR